MTSETLEKFVPVRINVNTTSTLPKLRMSEGPVFRVSPNYIKGQLPAFSNSLSGSLELVSLSNLCQSSPSRALCMCECSLVLFWSMPAPQPGTL